jgi:16S rRNA U1498 N3-methylase RsmE
MGKGDALVLLDGKGGRFFGEIESVSGTPSGFKSKDHCHRQETRPEITLCQAVIKSASMDYLIQKTSELGVTRISRSSVPGVWSS